MSNARQTSRGYGGIDLSKEAREQGAGGRGKDSRRSLYSAPVQASWKDGASYPCSASLHAEGKGLLPLLESPLPLCLFGDPRSIDSRGIPQPDNLKIKQEREKLLALATELHDSGACASVVSSRSPALVNESNREGNS